ncbi:MAG: phospholipase D-like domain-containing protein [Aeromicrobium sp.]|uniref:phospholipase D-like domain-containing protein n=1 Tax=Aeromicrobium sp. TaxID=1871063 RepID=UPI0039E6809D
MLNSMPSPRRIVWEVVKAWLIAVTLTVVGIMTTTKVRKVLRGQRAHGFPVTAPQSVQTSRGAATTYTYGDDLFDDMISAIEAAEHRVFFESFIVKGDAEGRRFKAALQAAAARGVQVYVVYDGFANLVVRPSFYRFAPGVHVLRYPIYNAGLKPFTPRRWGRDHRKILVVDDTVGFVGGYNIGSTYATQWRDTHVRITGSAVWDLANAFIDFWNTLRPGEAIVGTGSTDWDPRVRIHRNIPRQLVFPIRNMYLEAIDRATRRIKITAAYFIPDSDILGALLEARARGVEIDIIVPEISNHVVTDWLSRGFYGRLLEAGVRIHRYRDHMVHAKTCTIDGEWTTIGTANIDRLSLSGNYEINVEVVDPALAAHLEAVFARDLTNCAELTPADWERRWFVSRICELLLSPLRPLL